MYFPKTFSYDGIYATFNSDEKSTENLGWKAKVKLRGHKSELTLQGPINEESHIWEAQKQIGKKAISLCKSNLQKCVRRKESDKAIRTAYALYTQSPSETLRRIPIIMIEDSLPHPASFCKLVWWMAAVSKGYIMTEKEVSEMLGIVASMCETETYEVFNSKASEEIPRDWSGLSRDQQDFMWALELRKEYGGMKGDIGMLSYHQHIWQERLSETQDKWWKLLNDQNTYEIEPSGAGEFDKDDILLESLDFHCFGFLPQKIAKKVGLTEEEVRAAIWFCRSSINLRKPLSNDVSIPAHSKTEENYRKIYKELTRFTTWLLNEIVLKDRQDLSLDPE